jgi:iron complex transport system substrate-binding protein
MRRAIFVLLVVFAAAGAFADSCCASFPVVVTDARGVEVRIPQRPDRIISLAPSNTEILFELGVGHRVVGVTRRCDYPPAAKKIAQVGDVLISVERVVSLRPDLVVAHATMNASVIDVLERRGIRVVATNPESFSGLARDIRMVGAAGGADSRAGEICRAIDRAIDRVRDRAKTLARRPRMLAVIQEWPVWVAGSDTFIDEMIRIAGGTNAAGDIPWFGQMSMESMVMRAPDVILVLAPGGEGFFERAATRVTPAVRRGFCRSADPNLFVRPGPRLVRGLEKLSEIIAAAAREEP